MCISLDTVAILNTIMSNKGGINSLGYNSSVYEDCLKKEGMLFELQLAALQLHQISTKMVFMIKGIDDAPAEPTACAQGGEGQCWGSLNFITEKNVMKM